jgi:hypothetical protein
MEARRPTMVHVFVYGKFVVHRVTTQNGSTPTDNGRCFRGVQKVGNAQGNRRFNSDAVIISRPHLVTELGSSLY